MWQSKLKHFSEKLVFAHAAQNKIGGVYYSLPCLPPNVRSRVENIFVAALFRSSERKSCCEGNDAIFEILVEEINYLTRNGIVIDVNGEKKVIYFALGLLLGDNEALNSSMGYMESPSATHYCRYCAMTKEQNIKNRPLVASQKRTRAQYEADGFLDEGISGVKEHSIWNEVDFFHVVENPFLDVAHVLLEGVCRYAMWHILNYLVREKQYITFPQLNAKISAFNYSENGLGNKLPPIKLIYLTKKKTINLSAKEMHTFVLILPMLVADILGEKLNLDDKIWQYFSVLRQIMDITFAKGFRHEQFDMLFKQINGIPSHCSKLLQ